MTTPNHLDHIDQIPEGYTISEWVDHIHEMERKRKVEERREQYKNWGAPASDASKTINVDGQIMPVPSGIDPANWEQTIRDAQVGRDLREHEAMIKRDFPETLTAAQELFVQRIQSGEITIMEVARHVSKTDARIIAHEVSQRYKASQPRPAPKMTAQKKQQERTKCERYMVKWIKEHYRRIHDSALLAAETKGYSWPT